MVEGADGVNVAAPIFRTFLDKTLSNYPLEDFPKYNPDDEIGEGEGKTNKPLLAGKLEMEENLKVCKIPGKKNEYCLANKYCRDKDTDKKDFVSDHDILFYVNRDDPRGPVVVRRAHVLLGQLAQQGSPVAADDRSPVRQSHG